MKIALCVLALALSGCQKYKVGDCYVRSVSYSASPGEITDILKLGVVIKFKDYQNPYYRTFDEMDVHYDEIDCAAMRLSR